MLPFKKGNVNEDFAKMYNTNSRIFIMIPMAVSTKVEAEGVKELKTGFPDQEVFAPGDWF